MASTSMIQPRQPAHIRRFCPTMQALSANGNRFVGKHIRKAGGYRFLRGFWPFDEFDAASTG
ncbi:hypothetical protein GCM10010989_03660 [Croceicoccus pelagius]|uniref:Uncharacterized protein n=2 Tax=Croceicoccus pelagius TaxID=1703341 RepID=A0A916Y6Y0_9SPHN|nr:hypothetical protein GCM10010989_03660 [Croceicoccus pelagius]